MKLKKLIGGLILSSVLAAGVGVFVASDKENIKSTEAASTGTIIYLDAQSSGWFGANAKVAFWDHASSQFDEFTLDSTIGYYKTTVSGDMTSFNMFRGSALNWNSKWNQGGDDTISDYNLILATGFNGDTMTYMKSNLWTVTRKECINGTAGTTLGTSYVKHNASYSMPGVSYKSGYKFDGWYTSTTGGTKITSKTITSNTTLYARYTTASSLSGTLFVDLKDSGWADAAANYAVKFYERGTYSTDVLAWSTYVMGTATGARLVEIPYSGVTISPTHIEIMRYNSTNTKASWDANKDANLWSYTGALSITSIPSLVRIGKDGSSQDTGYFGFPKVIGGTGGAWADILYLDSAKLNGSKNAEYYSTSVTLAAGTQFKIQIGPYADGDYYATYTTHESIKNNFNGGGSNNINVVTAGTYAFYFDSYVGSLYITKVEIAEADEWAQYFLSHVGCDASGRDLPTGWTACATEYAKISGPAKNIVYGATAKESGTYVEQAVARYDVAVRNHSSLTKFIVNSSDTPRSAAINVNPIAQAVANSGSMIAIIAISSVSIAAIGGYFLFKKKKND